MYKSSSKTAKHCRLNEALEAKASMKNTTTNSSDCSLSTDSSVGMMSGTIDEPDATNMYGSSSRNVVNESKSQVYR